MRIDLVITELPTGGAERCLTEIAVGLDRRGFAVRVLAIGRLPDPPFDALVRRLQEASIPVQSMQAATTRGAPVALWRLYRAFRDDPPAIVQTFLHHANVLGTLAARLAGVRRCVAGIRVAQPNRWRSWLERRTSKRLDAAVCVSDEVKRFARHNFLPAELPVAVVPNGVDARRFAGAIPADWSDWGIPSDACVALFVGRLDPQKGLEDLFAAADQFLREGPDRWLVLAGDGPQKAWAEAACRRLPGGRAQCLGWRSDIAELLAAARLLVLTSRYEGMPNVILEAMAAARPVVCFDVEGIAHIFAGNSSATTTDASPAAESGPRHPPPADPLGASDQVIGDGDIDGFARAVSRFFQDDELAERRGQANRAAVVDRFSLAAMVDAYAQLYRRLAPPEDWGGPLADPAPDPEKIFSDSDS